MKQGPKRDSIHLTAPTAQMSQKTCFWDDSLAFLPEMGFLKSSWRTNANESNSSVKAQTTDGSLAQPWRVSNLSGASRFRRDIKRFRSQRNNSGLALRPLRGGSSRLLGGGRKLPAPAGPIRALDKSQRVPGPIGIPGFSRRFDRGVHWHDVYSDNQGLDFGAPHLFPMI